MAISPGAALVTAFARQTHCTDRISGITLVCSHIKQFIGYRHSVFRFHVRCRYIIHSLKVLDVGNRGLKVTMFNYSVIESPQNFTTLFWGSF